MTEPQPVRVREKLNQEPELPPLTRLAVGSAVLASQKLVELANDWVELAAQELPEAPGDTTEETELSPEALRHVLIGLVAALPGTVDAFVGAARPIYARIFKPAWGRAYQSAAAQPFRSLIEPVREQWSELAQAGNQEEQRSVAVARAAVADAFERIIQALGESPELQNLIRDQSTGLTRDALNEVRDQTLRADILTESIVRRLLRRPPREPLEPIVPVVD